MHSTGSVLWTMIERLRAMVDETDIDGKYNNDFLVRNVLAPGIADVLARVNMTQDNPIVLRHTIDLVEDQQFYTLPPKIQNVLRLALVDSHGIVLADERPRDIFNPRGQGWAIEGNQLSVMPYPFADSANDSDGTIELWYVPGTMLLPHYATNGTLNAGLDQMTLSSTPSLGGLDRRPEAYAGDYLRVLPASGVWEERVVASYNPQTRVATLRRPFTYASFGTNIYEVSPPGMQSLLEAIIARGAIKMTNYKKMTQVQRDGFILDYQLAMKTTLDNLSNLQARTGKFFDPNTIDNPDAGLTRLM